MITTGGSAEPERPRSLTFTRLKAAGADTQCTLELLEANLRTSEDDLDRLKSGKA
jgi:hypothetical protein